MEKGSTLLTRGLLGVRPAGATILTGGSGLQIEPNPGPNPLNYLGFTIDYGRRRLTLYDYVEGAWRVNPHVEGLPLDDVRYQLAGAEAGNLAQLFHVYSWKSGNGYHNFPTWIEAAALRAGR